MVQRKERQERLSKGNDGFQKGGFRPYQPDKGAGKEFAQNKGRGKDQEGKGEEWNFPQSVFSASETPNEEGYGQAWASDDRSASHWTDDSWTPDAGWFCTKAHTAWMVATPMNLANHPTHVVLDLGCTRSIGSRTAIERFFQNAWYCGTTMEFCLCSKSSNVATSTFQQHHLRPVSWPSCFFFLPQIKFFGYDR